MNEKFLSRGKREDTKAWIEGYYMELPEEQHGEQLHIIIDLDGQYNRIIPETAGCCAGLTDKNDKMIFEGDILKAVKYRFVVKFGKCGGVQNVDTEVGYIGFYVEPIGKDAKFLSEFLSDSGLRTDILYWINSVRFGVEIIGNIHDNPELSGGAE